MRMENGHLLQRKMGNLLKEKGHVAKKKGHLS